MTATEKGELWIGIVIYMLFVLGFTAATVVLSGCQLTIRTDWIDGAESQVLNRRTAPTEIESGRRSSSAGSREKDSSWIK